MSLAVDALGKISPWKEAWSFEAKILTIWEDTMIVNENMQKLLHMHHKIQATVEDDLIITFIHQLKEGDIFIISDFKVILNRGLVRVTRHRFRILFKCSTSVVAAASTLIPNPGLSLTSIDQILQKCIDYEYLIDMNTLKRYQRPPVVILQSFKIKVNGDKVSLQNVINISRVSINPDMQETVNFLNQYGIASHHFSRLRSNEVGDLVCVIDDESYDWKLIRTIDNLRGNNEVRTINMPYPFNSLDFFNRMDNSLWLEKLRRLLNIQSGDDNVFHYQLCSRGVQHFMIRIKILVEDGTSCGMFVLLDSAATKLLGRTCSDVFLLLEDEMDVWFIHLDFIAVYSMNNTDTVHSFFINSLENKLFSKFKQSGLALRVIALKSYDNQVISGVLIQLPSIKEMLANILCAKIFFCIKKC
ncbi:hypothetical protein Ahy_A06g028214 [Arachis hypogaea]|uniref:Replication protein A 70 kDa DNA-binding subunit B/D first OB fold domain-containing protein n=1 Tax=Arachis hypogaea TaxID=3818 RepID=A0A445CQN4_ARAHY|nr:hypothetical protein Ahy_A06g028214 [Arachis hypogaea]